jgi:chemotaxis signal transduction protein
VSEPTSEVLLFQVGARLYATDVRDVSRIGNPSAAKADDRLVRGSTLGDPFSPDRGIVVRCDDGTERTLVVDHVIGVRSVPRDHVRALPPLAASCLPASAVVGYALLDDLPTLLVDLPTLVREQRPGSAAGPERKEPNDG